MASADILRAAHTELPWAVMPNNPRLVRSIKPVLVADTTGFVIEGSECIANAAFIVRACNAHYQMLEALNVVRRSAAWTGLAEETKDLVCAAIAAAEAEAGR